MRNVGFVKVEQGEDECFLNIHGKGLRMSGGSSLQIYLIYEENGGCVGVWQREADNVNPALNETLHCTRGDAGDEENFEKINGVVLEHADGRRYAAVWDETPMDISGMKRWMPSDSGKGGAARQSSLPDEALDEREEMPEVRQEEENPLIRGEDLGALREEGSISEAEDAPELPEEEPIPEAPPARPAGRSLRVVLNGRARELPPKEDGSRYQFFDLLNFVDIDPNDARGELILRRNGGKAAYLDLLTEGDEAEIRWSEETI